LRIFNPVVQSRRYDPDGRYIRQWVPELGSLPAEYLHEPWRMSPLEQESYGVRLGVDYPLPIVEHAERKRQFESAYARLRSGERE
jgi:deoxyribodipyrimidine photo-lyase